MLGWGCSGAFQALSAGPVSVKVTMTGLASHWTPQAVSHGQMNTLRSSLRSLTLNLDLCDYFVGSRMSAFPFVLINSHPVGLQLTLLLIVMMPVAPGSPGSAGWTPAAPLPVPLPASAPGSQQRLAQCLGSCIYMGDPGSSRPLVRLGQAQPHGE